MGQGGPAFRFVTCYMPWCRALIRDPVHPVIPDSDPGSSVFFLSPGFAAFADGLCALGVCNGRLIAVSCQ